MTDRGQTCLGRDNIIADTLPCIYSEKSVNHKVIQYLRANFMG